MKVIKNEATVKSKFGINLRVYKTNTEKAGFVYIEVQKGHFEEFFYS